MIYGFRFDKIANNLTPDKRETLLQLIKEGVNRMEKTLVRHWSY